MTKEIPLTQGKVALVDDEDFEWLSQRKWYASRNGNTWYACRSGPGSERPRKMFKMHREVLRLTTDKHVDHINGDGLDNRKENLRICTPSENQGNARGYRHNTSGYRGVSFDKLTGQWRAYIGSKTQNYLGRFETQEEAALAYNQAAIDRFGEFATLNDVHSLLEGGKR